jgi:hypothetical protein
MGPGYSFTPQPEPQKKDRLFPSNRLTKVCKHGIPLDSRQPCEDCQPSPDTNATPNSYRACFDSSTADVDKEDRNKETE